MGVFFLSLGILLGSARILGELARRLGQPAILGELLAGILLGPTVLGNLQPEWFQSLFPPIGSIAVMRDGLVQLSVVLFLFVAGLEVDLSSVWRQGKAAAAVSLSGIVIPFAIGFGTAMLAPGLLDNQAGQDPLHFSLFIGTALAISALPVIAKTLIDLNLFRSDIGMVVISAAILQDLVGWIMFALVLGLIGAGTEHALSIDQTVLGLLLFTAGILTIGRWLFHRILPYVQAYLSWPGGVMGFVLTLALFGAAFTEWLGVHAIFGAFMVGVAVGDTPHLRERTRGVIDQFVSFFFAPLFFASIGLKVDFVANFDLGLSVVVLIIACIGKILGCGLGARLSGMPWRESAAIGFAMNSRGAMEIILGMLALQYGVIGDRMFVALVVMALVTSMLSGPLIQRVLRRPRPRRFLDYMPIRAFAGHLRAEDRSAAIGELAAAAAAVGNLDLARVQGAVMTREEAMATGLSNGIAVPHARLPGLAAPIVALGLSRAGVDFEAPDGKPAHFIVLLLTSDVDHAAQLDLLADVARTFADPELREQALKTRGYTEFRALMRTERGI